MDTSLMIHMLNALEMDFLGLDKIKLDWIWMDTGQDPRILMSGYGNSWMELKKV